ncbi:MAG: polyprenol monophosphomannose synthase [Candidatus Omnitrophota bacterium]|nr:polyprenol monophosphomannose synthase [Candidatus Omnitrophota bacterium]
MSPDNHNIIVIPTYNERNNIKPLLEAIDGLKDFKADVLFVDDNSPDGTAELIDEIRAHRPGTYLMRRPCKMGLGSAYIDGFRYALDKGYQYIFEMDADLSHSPLYLEQVARSLCQFDVVTTSRFRGELRNINRTPLRIINSILAAMFIKLLLGLKCSDPMSGFTGFRRKALEALDFPGFVSKGYAFQAEIKYLCKQKGFSLYEIPIIFKNRAAGASKISRNDIFEALLLPWKLKFR